MHNKLKEEIIPFFALLFGIRGLIFATPVDAAIIYCILIAISFEAWLKRNKDDRLEAIKKEALAYREELRKEIITSHEQIEHRLKTFETKLGTVESALNLRRF